MQKKSKISTPERMLSARQRAMVSSVKPAVQLPIALPSRGIDTSAGEVAIAEPIFTAMSIQPGMAFVLLINHTLDCSIRIWVPAPSLARRLREQLDQTIRRPKSPSLPPLSIITINPARAAMPPSMWKTSAPIVL